MGFKQIPLPYESPSNNLDINSYLDRLIKCLSEDLSFTNEKTDNHSHSIHSFPAKFPPQLPRKFITELTGVGDTVLDPMSGSGTTLLEALLNDRKAIGFDIDPIALLITRSKIASIDVNVALLTNRRIVERAKDKLLNNSSELNEELNTRWDPKTKAFIDYWFAKDTQLELLSLITEISKTEDQKLREFFLMSFSSIIITKSGGVSMAFDLGHTRPHRAKCVISQNGETILKQPDNTPISPLQTKKIRSAIVDFDKKVKQNIKKLDFHKIMFDSPIVKNSSVEKLPLESNFVDLIVTSPPYASNAIDYMRAHKFSLVWMDFCINELSEKRKKYIGGENITDVTMEPLPAYSIEIINEISKKKQKEGEILRRYYSEMTRALREMYRVLKPGKAAIIVVGSSILCGVDSQTQNCLAEIGKEIGFFVPTIGIRNIDRNKRMLPSSQIQNSDSQIQQRMHQEYVIGFYKPRS